MRPKLRFPDEVDWTPPRPVVIPAGTALYRVQPGEYGNPIHFGRDPQGDKRWNPPAEAEPQFGILYAGIGPQAAIVETLLHDDGGTVIGLGELVSRRLWTFTVKEDLALIDLSGPALKWIGQDARLLSTDDLRYPKVWSHALHQACPEACGLLYPARPAPRYTSLALFERSRRRLAASSASSRLLIDWIEPDSRKNIIDWLRPFGVSVHDDDSLSG